MKHSSKNIQPTHPRFPLENIIPITRARKEFFTLTDNVLTKSARYIITDHGVPKALLLPLCDSVRFFGGASIAADLPSTSEISENAHGKYSEQTAQFHSFFVADGWRDDTHSEASIKDIVRSQLAVRLIEKYGYPEKRIIIGCSVPVSNNHFVEIDILAHNGVGQALSLFIVTDISQFENGKDMAIDDLFTLVQALREQGQHAISLIGYYTREKKKESSPDEHMLLIDCRKYPTRRAWESARQPTLPKISDYKNILSGE